MLDTTGGLFSHYPNMGDIGGVVLGNSAEWISPTAMATYLDRLYVLDTGARQIWKYYGSSGYSQFQGDEAIFFSNEADLEQAIDFDLYAEDGSLLVLYRDGRIRYYDTRSGRIQWDEKTLAQNGMMTPLIAPVAVKIVGSGLNASIFVLDPGSGRLIQLSRGGTILTQYRILDTTGAEVLTRAADFAVTSSPMRIFVVAGDQLLVAER
jgi:outer membrane protein assembly factor BamB